MDFYDERSQKTIAIPPRTRPCTCTCQKHVCKKCDESFKESKWAAIFNWLYEHPRLTKLSKYIGKVYVWIRIREQDKVADAVRERTYGIVRTTSTTVINPERYPLSERVKLEKTFAVDVGHAEAMVVYKKVIDSYDPDKRVELMEVVNETNKIIDEISNTDDATKTGLL